MVGTAMNRRSFLGLVANNELGSSSGALHPLHGRCSEDCSEADFPASPSRNFRNSAHINAHCLALKFVDCQSCRDACPETAISFTPRLGGPFVPALDAAACTGCGACLSVCPSAAISIKAVEAEFARA